MKSDKNIAILYFSRSASAEAKAKSWNKNACFSHNKNVAKNLDRQSRKVLNKAGLDVFHSSECNQMGDSFGEKLSNAYQFVFDQGYDAVISVGNDCPQLKDVDWSTICNHLLQESVVIGPTIHQGAYLIGMTKDVFDPRRFSQLSWKTSSLNKDLLEYFENKPVVLLAEKRDINNWQDLQELSLLKNVSASLIVFIRSLILTPIVSFYEHSFCVNDLPSVQILSLRAPPTM